VARVLIVPCGCRGRALAAALRADGHAVRGTTRDPARAGEIAAVGAEPFVGDPDRIGTLMEALRDVTVVCWLMGTVPVPELHAGRLRMLWEKLVDTPVRGVVYEPTRPALPEGEAVARRAAMTWQIPLEVLTADPADHAAWLAAASGAVARLLEPAQ
jgi:nucleoside-diphosphate-sugar epimerase